MTTPTQQLIASLRRIVALILNILKHLALALFYGIRNTIRGLFQ